MRRVQHEPWLKPIDEIADITLVVRIWAKIVRFALLGLRWNWKILILRMTGLIFGCVAELGAQTLPSGFSEQVALSGLTEPTVVEFASDGRIFVAEKSGLIKVFNNLGQTTPTIFADLRTNVYNYGKSGLLGMALDANFPSMPYVYVLYTYDGPVGGMAPTWGDSCPPANADSCIVSARLSRLQADGNVMTGMEQVLVADWYQRYPGQPIGGLAFGPDGALYASAGDGASSTMVDYGQGVGPSPDPPGEGGALRSQDLRTPADPVALSGSIISIHPDTGQPLPQTTSMSVSGPTVDANGVKSFAVTSEYQGSQPTIVRVLEPTQPAAGKPRRFLYVLPVETGVTSLASQYSDGLEELRLLNVHNRYNLTLIAPSFHIVPWYGDHDSDPDRRLESFIIKDLVPFGDSFGTPGEVPQRWALGFSKSGSGSLSLILRHPNVFSAAAAWDAPAQLSDMTTFPTFGMAENFGTEENFDRYEIPALVVSSAEAFRIRDRLWISGDMSAWTWHMIQLDSQMTQADILHTSVEGGSRTHTWSSGWLEGAVASLEAKAAANYYQSTSATAFPVATAILTGTISSGTATALSSDDNTYYAVNSTTTGNRTAAWYGSFTGVSNNLTSLWINYKGNNSRNCTQTISIWRWSTSSWIQVDSRTVGTTEVAINSLAVSGTLADYVSGTSGSGEVRVRVQCQASANLTNRGDLMSIVYNAPIAPPSGTAAAPVDTNAQRIIAYGLRNPSRLAFRPGTDEIWVVDSGWNDWEEINRVMSATDGVIENFGWPCYEGSGTNAYAGAGLEICNDLYAESAAVTPPFYAYHHNEQVVSGEQCGAGNASISGLAFYGSGNYPAAYGGALFFSDYARNCIWVMLKGANGFPNPLSRTTFMAGALSPIDLKIGPSGDLFFTDFDGGMIRRIVYSTGSSDTTAPVRSNGQPSGTVSGPQVTLSLATNENATCRASGTAGTAYASMPYGFETTGGTVHSQVVPYTNGSYSIYVRCQDTAGNVNTNDFVISFTVAGDTTPPVRSNGQPSGTVSGPQVTLSLATNENATCRASGTAGTAYASMPYGFETTGGTVHSQVVPYTNGSYSIYVRCQDTAGNVNTNDFVISFTVAGDTTPPVRSNGQPSGTVSGPQVTLSLATNENATCRASGTAGTAYASMPYGFGTTGGTVHSQVVPYTNGSYSIYVRCQDTAGNVNTNDFVISFTVAGDTTPPVRSNGQPAGTVSGSQVTLSLATNENATCRASGTAGTAYASMPYGFGTTGGTVHSQVVPYTNGSYSIYVRCQDTAGNVNTNDFVISFTVAG